MAWKKRAPPKRKPRRKRPVARRVTRQRQAYKPRQKNSMRMKRQPFVETKKLTEQSYAGIVNPIVLNSQPTAQTRTFSNINISPVETFCFMARGIRMNEMIGRDIFSKGLKQKIHINLPQGKLPSTMERDGNENRPFTRITRPCPVYVVWGWLKQPLGSVLDPHSRQDPQTSRWTTQDVLDQIDHVTEFGNDLMSNPYSRDHGIDYLTFPDKRKTIWTRNVRLLKPRKLKSSVIPPDSRIVSIHNASETPGAVNQTADFGDYHADTGYAGCLQTTISWKTNRKIRYRGPETGTPTGIASDTWVPYSYIYVPQEHREAMITSSDAEYYYDASNQPVLPGDAALAKSYKDLVGDCSMEVRACHWFSDS